MSDRELLELAAKAFGFGKKNLPEKPHCSSSTAKLVS